MDAVRFDRLIRLLTAHATRRRALLAALLGVTPVAAPWQAAVAGPGCKDVGRKCKRKSQCCSGVCKGKKGRKRCKAHDTGGCPPGRSSDFCGGSSVDCTTSAGAEGTCETTTGKAGYCAADEAGVCQPCKKDADCRDLLGPGAACVVCAGCTATGGVGCATPNPPPP